MYRKRTFSINLLLVAALLAAPFCFTGVVRADEEKKQKTELHRKMEKIDDGMKKLKRSLKKADQNEASIKEIDTIIELATACKDMTPEKIGKLPEADRAKPQAEFTASITHLIETMGDMKKAVVAGDNDKAMKLHKELKEQEEEGHDKFIEDDDKAKEKDKEKSEK